jgi:predicted HicB family RNase H-like nuclease
MTHMSTKQVNAELPEPLSRRIKSDAAALGVTLNAYAAQAFERFLSMSVAQRRIYLSEAKQKKILGRKLAA